MVFNVRQPNLAALTPGKTKMDFDREALEFTLRRRAAQQELAQRSQQMRLADEERFLAKQQASVEQAFKEREVRVLEGKQKTTQQLADLEQKKTVSGIFEGNGYDAQVTNLVYRDLITRGVPADVAAKQAVDRVLQSKITSYTDPMTGQHVTQSRPGVFNQEPRRRMGGGDVAPSPPLPSPPPGPTAIRNTQAGQMGKTLYDMAESTGALPYATELWARTAGQLGLPFDQETVSDRQSLRLHTRSLIDALRSNPRYADRERTDLEKDFGFNPEVLDSPDALRTRITSVATGLKKELANEYRVANDPKRHINDRNNAKRAITDIENFLALVGEPPVNPDTAGGWKVERVE